MTDTIRIEHDGRTFELTAAEPGWFVTFENSPALIEVGAWHLEGPRISAFGVDASGALLCPCEMRAAIGARPDGFRRLSRSERRQWKRLGASK